jgi:GT2 family glycosyltransferase
MKDLTFQLTIVYVNYNSAQLIRDSLKSLRNQSFKNILVTIVENSPNNRERLLLEEISKEFSNFFEFKLFFPNANLGFAGGNNYVLKRVSSKYYFLLNGDTEVKSSDAIKNMIEYMDSNSDVGMLSPKIMYFDEPKKIWYAGAKVKPNSLYFSYHIGENEIDAKKFNQISETDYACGAALLVRKEVIDDIGLMFDFFFMYAEENEWNYRAKKKGYKIIYYPKSTIYHKVHLPSLENRWMFQTKPFQVYLFSRNNTIFTILHSKITIILGYLLIYQLKKTITQLYLSIRYTDVNILTSQLRGLYSGIKFGIKIRAGRATKKIESKENKYLKSLTPVSRSILDKNSKIKSMKEYDLAVAYRIYPKITKIPAVYPKDKLKLAEFSLKSFKESIGNLKVKMFVLLDNCPGEYDDLFRKYFNEKDLELIKLDGIGNQNTFIKQLDILLRQNDADYVYLAEDDYYYFKDQFSEIFSFMKSNEDVHFISPFDHKDYYTESLHDYKYEIRVSNEKHWRTATCSTCTFISSKSTLEKTHKIFRTYRHKKNTDGPIWLSLTKYNVFNLFKFIKYCFTSRIYRNYILLSWIFNVRQILFGKRWKLWVPMPTIATHLDSPYLSPTIDWDEFFKDHQE